jgi:hypothetical protein
VRHGKIKDRGARGAPAFHVVDETQQRPLDAPPTDAPPTDAPPTDTPPTDTPPPSRPPSSRPPSSAPSVSPRRREEVEPAAPSSSSTAAVAASPDATGRVTEFLAECCERDPDARITRSEILAAYVAWAGEREVQIDERQLATVLADQLPPLGIEPAGSVRHGSTGVPGRGWRGVRLREGGRRPPSA